MEGGILMRENISVDAKNVVMEFRTLSDEMILCSF